MKRNFHQYKTSVFKGTKINISEIGQQDIGATIGSNDFKWECVKCQGNQRMDGRSKNPRSNCKKWVTHCI